MYQFYFFGEFSVFDPEGRDVTPKSKKAQGVLALLAEGSPPRRTRRWLEDKLWSDRGQDQASGSMRQALFEIRKSLGKDNRLLSSDRNAVWLDPYQFTTDLDQGAVGREFLEGFDIADPEFDEWLLQMRMAYRVEPQLKLNELTGRRRIKIQCGPSWRAKSETSLMSQVVDDQIGKILSEFLVGGFCATTAKDADLIVQTSVTEEENGSALLVQIVDPVNDELVHSDHCFSDDGNSVLKRQDALGRFCWNIADRALEKLATRLSKSDILALRAGYVQEALNKLLTFSKDQMFESLDLFEEAIAHTEDGLFHAFKAWAMASLVLEGFLDDDAYSRSEISKLIKQAKQLSPDNSMVCAVASAVHVMMFERFEDAFLDAQRAFRDNPNNIFALQALSVCLAKRAEYDRAYLLSQHSRTISSFSKFEPMCNLHHALLCMQVGKNDEAQECSRLAADYSTYYRAPKRQLLGLYAASDQAKLAAQVSSELNALEKNFSIDRFLNDRSYPNRTLRNKGILRSASPVLSQLC